MAALALVVSLANGFNEAGSGAASGTVPLILYGEAGCPFTSAFVLGDLQTALAELGPLVAVTYIPFGNAYYITEACGGVPAPDPCYNSTSCLYNSTVRGCFDRLCSSAVVEPEPTCFAGNVRCQHGAVECYADRIQACAVEVDTETAFPLSRCMFAAFSNGTLALGLSTPPQIAAVGEECAALVAADWNEIGSCVNSSTRGDAAVRAMARLTPVHPGVPYLTVNGSEVDTSLGAIEASDESNSPSSPAQSLLS